MEIDMIISTYIEGLIWQY